MNIWYRWQARRVIARAERAWVMIEDTRRRELRAFTATVGDPPWRNTA